MTSMKTAAARTVILLPLLLLGLLPSFTLANSAKDFELTGWWSDMLVDDRAGLFDPKFLCKGTFQPITPADDRPILDGTGKTCYMNPIAASFRSPTIIWFKDGNGMDTGAPGFTMHAVAFTLGNFTEYWPSDCNAATGVCSDCSNLDPVRKGYGTANDETCDVLGSNKLCAHTSYYDGLWNVTDCALVATVGDDSGVMMAGWNQIGGFEGEESAAAAYVGRGTVLVASLASLLVAGATAVL